MDVVSWLLLVSGVIGLGVAGYGALVLTTGRTGRAERRAFRTPVDAGRYYLCIGVALTLLASAALLNHHGPTAPVFSTLPIVMAILAMVLTGLAVIRYAPRRNRRR
jgi:hypothetical protein